MEEKKDNFRHILRVAGVDLNGNKKILNELRKIKGVSFAFANAICKLTGVDKNQQVGYVDEKYVSKIEEVIKEPAKFGIPSWMLNRRDDPEEGEDRHLIGPDLTFTNQTDVRIMQKIKCYKGFRHHFRLPLRGQRTKSNFRRNKGKVAGVSKSKQAKGRK